MFGQKPDSDPVMLDLLPETYSLSMDETLDHVDRALDDPEIHDTYSRDQIGIGLQLIYSNSCSNICFCYLEARDELRRVQGIRHLVRLYQNYFDRYCLAPVGDIGNDHLDGGMGYLCYMLWDIFVLYPGNASEAMIAAGLDVMANGIQMKNDNCIVSAIHGLGHWAMDDFRAVQILQQWLRNPTTQNSEVLDYAEQATTGCIL
ncbi:MAG: hypothetical protein ACQESR_29205 [Planctomycetota bacterium]